MDENAQSRPGHITLQHFLIFGSVRSELKESLCPSVLSVRHKVLSRPLNLHLSLRSFPGLSKVSLRSLSGLFPVCLRYFYALSFSIRSLLRRTDGAQNTSSCLCATKSYGHNKKVFRQIKVPITIPFPESKS